MKKQFKVNNLSCAHCASRLENGISKIEGVKSATVNFMSQNLTLEADDENFDEVLNKAVTICKKLDPNWEIVK